MNFGAEGIFISLLRNKIFAFDISVNRKSIQALVYKHHEGAHDHERAVTIPPSSSGSDSKVADSHFNFEKPMPRSRFE